MPTIYAGNPASYATNITLPSDGDPRSAASVNVPLEALADRTAFLLAGGMNVLADLTALAAITTPSDGMVRHVLGHGHFVFKTSATTGLSPFRVAAADATPGGWVASNAHETTRTVYVPCSRMVGLTSNGTVPAAIGPALGNAFMNPLDNKVQLYGGTVYWNVVNTHATNAYGILLPLDEYLVDGATISGAALAYYSQGIAASGARFGLVRYDRVGVPNTPLALRSAGFLVTGGTGVAGDLTLSYTADQNNVIDLSAYSYAAVAYDEHGVGAGAANAFHAVSITMTGIADARR